MRFRRTNLDEDLGLTSDWWHEHFSHAGYHHRRGHKREWYTARYGRQWSLVWLWRGGAMAIAPVCEEVSE